MRHLEQEVKLDVGPDWAMPDLSGAVPGSRALPLPALGLDAVYFDTPARRLASLHISLRYRRETERLAVAGYGPEVAEPSPGARERAGVAASTTQNWTVKLPSSVDGGVLSRTELNWAADEDTQGAPAPPAEVTALLAGVSVGEPVRPIAHLRTQRQRTELRGPDNRVLAEVVYDTVTGTNLLPDLAGEAASEVHFTEVEVELAAGAPVEVVDAVVHRLNDAGARVSLRRSKLATVLELSAPQAQGGAGDQAGRRDDAGAALTMSEVLQQQAKACLDRLLEHDIPLRLDDPDPEHVHRSRAATRRLRSILRAYCSGLPPASLPEPGTLAVLREDLRWLGRALGKARDADVRCHDLGEASLRLGYSSTGPDSADGGVSWILQMAEEDRKLAHLELVSAMNSPRYVECLRRLEVAGRSVGVAASARPSQPPHSAVEAVPGGKGANAPAPPSQAADSPLRALSARQWRALRRSVRRLGAEPAEGALHKVRIEAKRLRYIANAAAPLLPLEHGRAAAATAKAATRLQDILGAEHDAWVNTEWLHGLLDRLQGLAPRLPDAPAPPPGPTPPGPTPPGPEELQTAMAAGELAAIFKQVQQAKRKAWLRAWSKLDRAKLRRWAEAGPQLVEELGSSECSSL